MWLEVRQAECSTQKQFFCCPVPLPDYKSIWRKSQTTSVLVPVVWSTWSNRRTGGAPQRRCFFLSFLVCGPPATLKALNILSVNINVFIHNSLLPTTSICLARISHVNVYNFPLFHELKLAISTCEASVGSLCPWWCSGPVWLRAEAPAPTCCIWLIIWGLKVPPEEIEWQELRFRKHLPTPTTLPRWYFRCILAVCFAPGQKKDPQWIKFY